LCNKPADLLAYGVAFCAKPVGLGNSFTVLPVKRGSFVCKVQLSFLKLFAHVLFNEFKLVAYKLNVNHRR
jgi:hypothetical protein